MTLLHLDVDSRRTYWRDLNRIYYTEKDTFGSVITHTILEADTDAIIEVWDTITFAYRYGRQAKMREIKQVLEIRD